MELLEAHLTASWGPRAGLPLVVLALRPVRTEHPAAAQVQGWLLPPGSGPRGGWFLL